MYWNPDGEQWPYFIYNDEQLGCEWRKVEGERDVYEQVIVRKEKDPGLQSCFYTFPELDEYSTKDLYQPHPDLPHHWRHVGRADNIIVFSNGEKLNPTTIEKTIEDDPRVKGALVVGSGRFEPALIVEPVLYPKNVEGEESFLDSIWPKVLLANNDSVAHGKISRPLIGISNPSKPFLRAGKGTVQRAGTVKLYGEEIEQIYNHSEQTKLSQLPPLDVSSEDGLAKSIQILFESQLESTNLELDTDYFSAGKLLRPCRSCVPHSNLRRRRLPPDHSDFSSAAREPRGCWVHRTCRNTEPSHRQWTPNNPETRKICDTENSARGDHNNRHC